MTNVLVKNLLAACLLGIMGIASAQSISYQSSFDFSAGATFSDNQSVANEETAPTDIAFSNDGMKVFTIGGEADEINQYALTAPFDISGGLSHEGSYSVTSDETSPFSLSFNLDGSQFYVLGSGSDRVYQYSMSSNFDITSTVTPEGDYYVGLGNPNSFAFNADGTRFYVGTTTGHKIYQYNVSNAFDVTTGTITTAGSSDQIYYSVFDFEFANDGKEIFILNTTDGINHFSLGTPYDVSSVFTEVEEVFSVASEESNSYGFALAPSGNRFFIIGTFGDDINQFEMNIPAYSESIINDGSLEGHFNSFGLSGETFANPGTSLIFNTDYQISNLPAGLIPDLAISSEGTFGTLSFTGKATSNQNGDDVADLTFTFNNSAFTGGDASAVANAVGASSGISIDFRSNYTPIVSYGKLPSVIGATFNPNVLDVSSEMNFGGDLEFNDDGTKLFITDYTTVYEYTLTNPFDVSSGASYSSNSYYVGGEENSTTGITFSTDGMHMYVVGQNDAEVEQYSLSSAFDLTSTIIHQGSFSVAGETTGPQGIDFSPDGGTMLISGPDLYVYNLSTPFDITSTVSFVNSFDQSQNILSAVFGPDGTQILYTNTVRAFGTYELEIPYHLSVVTIGSTISVLTQDTAPRGVAFSPDRKKMFMLGSSNDYVYQYTVSPAKLEESFVNNGSMIGSVSLRVVDDQFNNAGATLTQGLHYSVVGLPAGLSSSIAVASNGLTGELTLTGVATNNSIASSVDNLEITFNNSAFKNSDAADVINAVGADSYIDVQFKELSGQLFGSDAYQLAGLTFDDTPISVVAQTGLPYGLIFNNDGTKMCLVDGDADAIIQYTLSTPYDVSTHVLDGTPLDISGDETVPYGIAFNDDGTRLFLVGTSSDKVHQYILGTPYDINGIVTPDGTMNFTNGIGITFSSEGSRMFLISGSNIYQYALNTPYDITDGASQVGSAAIGSANSYSPRFSPNGKDLFVLGGSHRNIYRFPLAKAFDITDGITYSESFNVSAQDTGPLSMTISGDGKTFYVTGGAGDDINVYHLPGISFSEVAANSGALDGTYTFTLVGDSFTNKGGNLTASTHFNITGLPAGLSGNMSVSADGSTAIFSITGNATNHQDEDDASIDLGIAFLDGAFASGDASSITNTSVSIQIDLDFTDNGTLTYIPGQFNEDYLNQGEVLGEVIISIVGETFSKSGLLTLGEDYSISNIPSGLTPELVVAGNKGSANLSFSGIATNHQDANDVNDLVFTFENSAFTTSDAQYVFNAVGHSSGIAIDFKDNNPSIRYGQSVDIGTGVSPKLVTTFSIANETTDGTGMALSDDGTKMYVLAYGEGLIHQYALSTPFDISSGVSLQGSADISDQEVDANDITFNNDGSKFFVTSFSNDVLQYSLSTPFDVLSTITYDGLYDVASQGIQTAAVTFSEDGYKMFTVSSSSNVVNQYSLTTPFDVTSGVTFDGSPYPLTTRNYTDIIFSSNGMKMFLANSSFPGSSAWIEFELTIPFDITTGVSSANGFSFTTYENGLSDSYISPDNTQLFMLGSGNDMVYQFDLITDGFEEIDLNNGEIDGSLEMAIIDEKFTNAGGLMEYGTDYQIDNLPSGLAAVLEVSADGRSANLSLSGKAEDHQDEHDVELQFTFYNSAFVAGNAANVANATSAASTRFIDFRDNNPSLLYGDPLNPAVMTYSGNSLDISNEDPYPYGLTLNSDGTRLYMIGDDTRDIYEYSLSEPYDLSSTVVYTGNSLDLAPHVGSGEDLRFSADGNELFVLSRADKLVFQFSLSIPFDLNTATASSNTLDISFQEPSAYGLELDPSGTRLYVGGSDEIQQYSLSNPNDLQDASHLGSVEVYTGSEAYLDAYGLVLSSDGRYVGVVYGEGYYRFELNVPFDVTQGMLFDDYFDLSSQDDSAEGIAIKPDGSKVFITGESGSVFEYSIDLGGFTETAANEGIVEGEASIYLLDDNFTNKGATLQHGVDYTISNLPSGLTPILTIAADGYSAVLTMTGSANAHGDDDDISGLEFSFSNSAFSNYSASEIANAVGFSSGLGIDYSPYTDNDITAFSFDQITGDATIDAPNHTVSAVAEAGTDVTQITPEITLSPNASVTPDTGVEQDFTTAVTYTVTAEDGTEQEWEISIEEESVAPNDITLSSTTIDENSPEGTVIAELSAVDANFGDSFTFYTLEDAENDDYFFIPGAGNQLVTSETPFDFETKSSYTLTIQARDEDFNFFNKEFTITVNDVNEAPTDITLDNATLDESNPIGTTIGIFSTDDVDGDDSHTYTITGECVSCGPNGTDNFRIVGNELQSNGVFDFEDENSFTIVITSTDAGGLATAKSFTIDINDLPAQVTSIVLDNNTLDENESAGTLVGNLTTFGEDLSGSYTYELVAGTGDTDNTSFSISGSELLTTESFNFETQSSYSIHVMTDDGIQTGTQVFTISINDVSEAPTDITLVGSTITENNLTSEVIGSLSTTDEDAGESFTYSLVSGSGDTDNASFDIVGNELLADAVFDFEAKSNYSVRIGTDDGNGGTFEKVFAITINDENETIVVVSLIEDQELDEGFATMDIDLNTVFLDQDDDELTFEVNSSNTDVVTVTTTGSTLTITEVGGFGSSTITVTADDGSGVTNSDEFVVTVVDVNEAPMVANAIADQSQQEGFGTFQISYADVFTDGDGDVLSISVSSDETSVVTATLLSGELIEITEVGLGTGTITLTADDERGEVVSDVFTFTVTETPNTAPVIADELGDESQEEGFGSVQISYADVFTDADGDVLTISVSSDETSVVTAALVEGDLIEITEVGIGTSTITLTADDERGGVVSETFTFTVTEIPNTAPVVANELEDESQEEGFGSIQISYADVFTDTDGDPLSISISSSETSVVTVAIIEGDLIEITEVGIGTSTITVKADDARGGVVSETFTFEVTEQTILALEDEIAISVFPNPTSDYLNIQSHTEMRVNLSDLNGRELKADSGRSIQMDIESLAEGIYLLIIQQGDQTIKQRIIKAN